MPADDRLAAALALYDAARAECDAAHEILVAVLDQSVGVSGESASAQLMRIDEAATYLGLSRTTAFALAKAGALQTVEVPGVGRRVRLADADAYVEGLQSA